MLGKACSWEIRHTHSQDTRVVLFRTEKSLDWDEEVAWL